VKVLLSILREMADLPNDPDAIALALNSLGLAVEEMDVVGVPIPGVVTARIVRMEKHPDAAKMAKNAMCGVALQICRLVTSFR
jgi:phenylalanyl-tRNA synthetase beta chain